MSLKDVGKDQVRPDRDEDDDAVTNRTDRQRLEMWTNHRSDLHAVQGSVTIHAWWFRLSTDIVAGSSFFHIFQIKADHYANDTYPIMTFGLNSMDGLYIDKHTEHSTSLIIPILPLELIKGRWIQAVVKTYHATRGWAEVSLKYADGGPLYWSVVEGQFWWSDGVYNYPKWGLYRRLNPNFNPLDSIDLQNVQFWVEP